MRALLYALSAATIMSLSACAQTTPEIHFPEADFSQQSPIRLNVASVNVVDDFYGQSTNSTTKDVAAKFPNPIQNMIRKWARERIQTSGGQNRLEVIIEDAHATQTSLPRKDGIEGTFTKEPAARVDAGAKVTMKLYTPERSLPMAQASGQAQVSRPVQEDASPYDYQKAYNDMTLDLMQRLDRELENQINSYFSRYKSF